MGRITVTVVSVTMATVYVAEERNMYMLMDIGKRSSFSINGTWVTEV